MIRNIIKKHGIGYVIAMSVMFSGFTAWASFVIVSLIRILG
jgi:hypothetical protein